MLRGASSVLLCTITPPATAVTPAPVAATGSIRTGPDGSDVRITDGNPYRKDVLMWYRKMLKAAFDVQWPNDEDAIYVLDETRRMFRRNQGMRDVELIARKVTEAEMRYGLAVHYKIPYPRMYHHAQGTSPGSGVVYSPYLDSHYDGEESNDKFIMEPGRTNAWVGSATTGSGLGTAHIDDKNMDVDYDKRLG
jgi:hypothetical protein